MTTDEQTPVASSATPDPVVAGTTTPTLDRLSTEERATWRKTGQLPDVIPAASSPAEPDKAASTDALPAPASEPGTPKPKKNAESRIQELLAERAALRAELEAAKRPASPSPSSDVKPAPAPSAAPMGEKFPDYERWAQTQPADGQSYEDYIDARAVHVFQQQQQAYEFQQAKTAAERDAAERLTTYRKHAESFIADHGDYWQVIAPVTDHAPHTPTADALGDVIVRSPNPPQVLYHLGSHLEDFNRLLSLPPHQAAYELGQLAASLAAPATPAIKTLSTAPEPPPTLRSKPATPVDDVDAAVKRGDFASYKLAMNRRSVAGR